MNNHDNSWILVCDSTRARLFVRRSKEKEPLALVQEFEHPQGRAKVHDLVSDRQGRTQQSGGAGPAKGSRAGMEPHTDPKTVEAEHFAHSLADMLNKGLSPNANARLVLVAPPAFLGILRETLSEPVRKRVVASLDKDFVHLDIRELPERLAEVLKALPA